MLFCYPGESWYSERQHACFFSFWQGVALFLFLEYNMQNFLQKLMKNIFARLSATTSRFIFQTTTPENEPSFFESLKNKLNDLGNDISEGTSKTYKSAVEFTNSAWEKIKGSSKELSEVPSNVWEAVKKFYNEKITPFYENTKMRVGSVMKDVETFFSENGKKLSAETKKGIETSLNETKGLKLRAQKLANDMADWAKKAKTDTTDYSKNKYEESKKALENLGDDIKAKEEQLIGKIILGLAKSESKPEKK